MIFPGLAISRFFGEGQASHPATPPDQLAETVKPAAKSGAAEQMARLERELLNLQSQVKAVEHAYGIDNLHLTLAQSYLKKLFGNARMVRWLGQHHPEYLEQFQSIAEITALPVIAAEDAPA